MGSILPSRQRVLQHSCCNCNELFTPKPQNRHHQKYCLKPECRKVSKRDAQQRWLNSEKGAGYFSGPQNVARVQEWRKLHEEYWKRKKSPSTKAPIALQDLSNAQVIENKGSPQISQIHALQDLCIVQPALIIGLIATLTGSTLQDDIAATSRRFIDSGRDILGKATLIPTTS